MSTIVIMPGGFHPFHAGHYALYQSAIKAFPGAEVYVAASDDTKTRPFPFAIKEKLAKVAGVAPGHFVQVKSPFRPEEITSQYDPEQDVLIFVRSEKDKTEQPKPGGTKKDGTPAYFQPYSKDQLQPFSKHAYIAYLPTVEFGPGITSATEIRNAWPKLDDRRKTAMVMSLYPATQKNPKLAANVVKMLDLGMGSEQQDVAEGSRKSITPEQMIRDAVEVYKQEAAKENPNTYILDSIKSNINDIKREIQRNKQGVAEGSLNEFFSPGRDDDEGENPYDPLSFPEFKTMLALRLAGNTKGITVSRGSDSGMVKISINDRHRIVPLNIHGVAAAVKFIKQQGIAEGANDTIYPNAEVIKSKNGKPVGEIYQDGNSWGAFHYRADRGYDFIDSREEAIEALKDLHQETGRSRPNYTIKGVAESNVTESTDYLEEK